MEGRRSVAMLFIDRNVVCSVRAKTPTGGVEAEVARLADLRSVFERKRPDLAGRTHVVLRTNDGTGLVAAVVVLVDPDWRLEDITRAAVEAASDERVRTQSIFFSPANMAIAAGRSATTEITHEAVARAMQEAMNDGVGTACCYAVPAPVSIRLLREKSIAIEVAKRVAGGVSDSTV